MIRSRVTRFTFAAAVGLALPVGGAVALGAGPAGAAKTSDISCAKLVGTYSSTGGSAQFKSCTGNTGGASKKTTTLASGGVLKWKNGKTTTTGAYTSATPVSPGTCASGDIEEAVAGPVTGDTTGSIKPAPSTSSPGSYSADICLNSTTGALSLAPSTKFVFAGPSSAS